MTASLIGKGFKVGTGASWIAGAGIALLLGGLLATGFLGFQLLFMDQKTREISLAITWVAFAVGPLLLGIAVWVRLHPGPRKSIAAVTLVLTLAEIVAFIYTGLVTQWALLVVGGIFEFLGLIFALKGVSRVLTPPVSPAMAMWAHQFPGSVAPLPPPPPPPPYSGGKALPYTVMAVAIAILLVGSFMFYESATGTPHTLVVECDFSSQNITLPAGPVYLNWTSNGPDLEVQVVNSTGATVYDVTSDSSADAGNPNGSTVPAGTYIVGCAAYGVIGMGPEPLLAIFSYR